MPEITDRHVLVGVDGSVESLAALGLAADEAALRHAPLLVTHAWAGPHWRPVRTRAEPASRAEAERLLATSTAWLHRNRPGVAVTGRLVLGDPADVLANGSVTAQLVVVGHRGSGLASLGWGSVAAQLSRRTKAPLMVRAYRPRAVEPPPGAPVVVAVAAEPSSRTLRFAFEQAARYGVPLTPCYVSPRPAGGGDRRARAARYAEAHEHAEHELSAALEEWSVRYPAVDVRPRVRPGGDVARALTATARRARLLVIGAGPDRAVTELLRGSVSRGVLRAAACPVAVMPEPAPEPAAEPVGAATGAPAAGQAVAGAGVGVVSSAGWWIPGGA
jgi:nucleotide-binding universal stress UspA family protein